MTNLSSLLDEAAADQPDRPALRMDDLVLTYAQFREAVGRMPPCASSLSSDRARSPAALAVHRLSPLTRLAGPASQTVAAMRRRRCPRRNAARIHGG